MNRLIVWIFLILFASSNFAQSADELFKQGIEQYKNQEFTKSVQTFEQILSKDYESDAVYYNLGNGYYRLGQLGKAILNYERALRLNPSDEDIKHNLTIANNETIDKVEVVPRLFIFQWWDTLVSFFTVNGWTRIVFGMFFLTIIVIGFFLLSTNISLKRIAFLSMIPVLIFFAFSLILLLTRLNVEYNHHYAIVTEDQTTAKYSPDLSSRDSFIIHEGIKVEVLDKLDNWIKVSLADGKVGWIVKESIEVI